MDNAHLIIHHTAMIITSSPKALKYQDLHSQSMQGTLFDMKSGSIKQTLG